jgi:hypothetical protein
VSLWRRFFEEREAEEEEQLQIIADTLVRIHFDRNSDNGEVERPIDSQEAVEARRHFIQDYYRRIHHRSGVGSEENPFRQNYPYSQHDPVVDRLEIAVLGAREAHRELRQLNQPNLDIPLGQEYVYRAQ